MQGTGDCPKTQARLIGRLYRSMMPGLSDEDYAEADEEIEEAVNERQQQKDMMREATVQQTVNPPGTDSQEYDDTGEPLGNETITNPETGG